MSMLARVQESLDSTVGKMFQERMAALIGETKDNMLSGGLCTERADTTAMNLKDVLGYVRGLETAWQIIKDIERELLRS